MRFQGEDGILAKWRARCLAQNGGEQSNECVEQANAAMHENDISTYSTESGGSTILSHVSRRMQTA